MPPRPATYNIPRRTLFAVSPPPFGSLHLVPISTSFTHVDAFSLTSPLGACVQLTEGHVHRAVDHRERGGRGFERQVRQFRLVGRVEGVDASLGADDAAADVHDAVDDARRRVRPESRIQEVGPPPDIAGRRIDGVDGVCPDVERVADNCRRGDDVAAHLQASRPLARAGGYRAHRPTPRSEVDATAIVRRTIRLSPLVSSTGQPFNPKFDYYGLIAIDVMRLTVEERGAMPWEQSI